MKYIRRPLTFLIHSIFVIQCFAQDIVISGKLLEHQTGLAIPFAHVYVKGTTTGTLTNIEGSYALNLPAKHANDSIIFSCVGFQSSAFAINQLTHVANEIRLRKSEIVLDQVVVSNLSAKDIWRNALKRKKENFLSDRFRLTGFYRTTFQEDGQFARLLEAAVYVHGDRFLQKQAAIEYLHIRKTKDLREHKWKVHDGYLEHLVNGHPFRWIPDFLHPRGINRYDFTLADILFLDKERYYVIDATGPDKNRFDAQMLIKANNFEIYRVTIFWKPANDRDFSWAWEQKKDARFFCDEQTSVYEYVEFKGKMVPKRSSWHRKGRVIDNEEHTLFHTESIDELLITAIDTKTYKFESKSPIEVQNIYRMADYFPYDASFWSAFNKPVDSKFFTKAKQKLEEYQPIESQFREYSGLRAK